LIINLTLHNAGDEKNVQISISIGAVRVALLLKQGRGVQSLKNTEFLDQKNVDDGFERDRLTRLDLLKRYG
jgi:hypothetical protein